MFQAQSLFGRVVVQTGPLGKPVFGFVCGFEALSPFAYEVICSVIFPRNVVPLKLQSRYIFRYKILENVVCLVFRYQDKNGS